MTADKTKLELVWKSRLYNKVKVSFCEKKNDAPFCHGGNKVVNSILMVWNYKFKDMI